MLTYAKKYLDGIIPLIIIMMLTPKKKVCILFIFHIFKDEMSLHCSYWLGIGLAKDGLRERFKGELLLKHPSSSPGSTHSAVPGTPLTIDFDSSLVNTQSNNFLIFFSKKLAGYGFKMLRVYLVWWNNWP